MKRNQVYRGVIVKLEDGPQQNDYLNFEGVRPSAGKPQKGIILSCSVLSSPKLHQVSGILWTFHSGGPIYNLKFQLLKMHQNAGAWSDFLQPSFSREPRASEPVQHVQSADQCPGQY